MTSSECEMDLDLLLGFDDRHVVNLDESLTWGGTIRAHPGVVKPLSRLQTRAAEHGFDLRVVSGFRSFERQRAIWNAKAAGQRTVLDASEQPVDILAMDTAERLRTLLCWSAVPGLSRHHWGTDIDVIDAAAVPLEYSLQLTVAETEGGGPFAPMHDWLDQIVRASDAEGFRRPYDGLQCAVAREPWHLSYLPVAAECQSTILNADLGRKLAGRDIGLWSDISAALPGIVERYVRVQWDGEQNGFGVVG